jgi:hypothetical protein
VHRALGSVVCFSLFACSAFAVGPDSDCHTTQDSSKAIYADSAFAHGYRHGYEEGFHAADRDVHLSLFAPPDRSAIRVPKNTGYRSGFGSKDSFRRGFEQGFRYGYLDSVEGETFRLIPSELNELAVKDNDFDRGVRAGFEGLADGCRQGFSQAFCSGLTVGRSMSGAANDTRHSEVAAVSKR